MGDSSADKKPEHKTLFEKHVAKCGIIYNRIHAATPWYNGKIEHQHRTDESQFYNRRCMYSPEDSRKQIKTYNKKQQHLKKLPKLRRPNSFLQDFRHFSVQRNIRQLVAYISSLVQISLLSFRHLYYFTDTSLTNLHKSSKKFLKPLDKQSETWYNI